MNILVINGPNINMLGIREPEVYGSRTYTDLIEYVVGICTEKGASCDVFQSNHEGAIVDRIQAACGRYDGIVINPAAYTHTSVAILDALKAVAIPAVEVHLSNTDSREDFRRFSYVSLYAERTIKGKGFAGYKEAIEYLADKYGR